MRLRPIEPQRICLVTLRACVQQAGNEAQGITSASASLKAQGFAHDVADPSAQALAQNAACVTRHRGENIANRGR